MGKSLAIQHPPPGSPSTLTLQTNSSGSVADPLPVAHPYFPAVAKAMHDIAKLFMRIGYVTMTIASLAPLSAIVSLTSIAFDLYRIIDQEERSRKMDALIDFFVHSGQTIRAFALTALFMERGGWIVASWAGRAAFIGGLFSAFSFFGTGLDYYRTRRFAANLDLSTLHDRAGRPDPQLLKERFGYDHPEDLKVFLENSVLLPRDILSSRLSWKQHTTELRALMDVVSFVASIAILFSPSGFGVPIFFSAVGAYGALWAVTVVVEELTLHFFKMQMLAQQLGCIHYPGLKGWFLDKVWHTPSPLILPPPVAVTA